MSFQEVLPTRSREEVSENIGAFLDNYAIRPEQRARLFGYIKELENGAWEGGAGEGYDHGYQECESKHMEDK